MLWIQRRTWVMQWRVHLLADCGRRRHNLYASSIHFDGPFAKRRRSHAFPQRKVIPIFRDQHNSISSIHPIIMIFSATIFEDIPGVLIVFPAIA
jgi:hypothetical protein